MDNYGCLVIPQGGSGGKPKYFINVPKVQKDSSNVTKITTDNRSQIIEQVEGICSSPDQDNLHVKQQRVNNIKRDKDTQLLVKKQATR